METDRTEEYRLIVALNDARANLAAARRARANEGHGWTGANRVGASLVVGQAADVVAFAANALADWQTEAARARVLPVLVPAQGSLW